MKAEDIKKTLFEGFLKWLEETKMGDHFSMDVWMTKAWDHLFAKYVEDAKGTIASARALDNLSTQAIEGYIKGRKTKEEQDKKKTEEEEKKASESIEKTRKEMLENKKKGFSVVDKEN